MTIIPCMRRFLNSPSHVTHGASPFPIHAQAPQLPRGASSSLSRCLPLFPRRLLRRAPASLHSHKTAMNFGQKGRELLQELKRSDWLPLYSEDAVSRCLLECQGHMAQIRPALAQEMVSESGGGGCESFVRARSVGGGGEEGHVRGLRLSVFARCLTLPLGLSGGMTCRNVARYPTRFSYLLLSQVVERNFPFFHSYLCTINYHRRKCPPSTWWRCRCTCKTSSETSAASWPTCR